jgi:hypothetical protein
VVLQRDCGNLSEYGCVNSVILAEMRIVEKEKFRRELIPSYCFARRREQRLLYLTSRACRKRK